MNVEPGFSEIVVRGDGMGADPALVIERSINDAAPLGEPDPLVVLIFEGDRVHGDGRITGLSLSQIDRLPARLTAMLAEARRVGSLPPPIP
jgi:hypothetical protein